MADEFDALMQHAFADEEVVLAPGSLGDIWRTFFGLLVCEDALGVAVVAQAMATVPWVAETWKGDPDLLTAWVNENSTRRDEGLWDALSEANKAGAVALKRWLRDHDVPRLAIFAPMPWGEHVFTTWSASAPEPRCPQCRGLREHPVTITLNAGAPWASPPQTCEHEFHAPDA